MKINVSFCEFNGIVKLGHIEKLDKHHLKIPTLIISMTSKSCLLKEKGLSAVHLIKLYYSLTTSNKIHLRQMEKG